MLGYTAHQDIQYNRTLRIHRKNKSTKSGTKMRTRRGFERSWAGRERARLGKAPMRHDDGMQY